MELNILTFNELDPSEASLKATRSEVPCDACRRRKEGVLSETVGMFGTMEVVVVVVVEMGSTCSARANSAALDGAVRRSFLWSGELVLLFMMIRVRFFGGKFGESSSASLSRATHPDLNPLYLRMGNLCMTDDRSSRLKKRRERERLVANKYRSFQTNPDEQRSSDNGDQLEIGFAQSEHCHRCKCKWNVVRRRHHCRRCKHSFCSNHSSRTTSAVAILQEKGLKDDNIQTAGNPTVRVCDNCFYRLARKSDGQASWQ